MTFTSKAQNLVQNGSFESGGCPGSFAQWATGWIPFNASPDYFNSCTSFWGVDIPQNMFGWQQPAHGNAYSGLIAYYNSTSLYREYIARPITPLIVGNRYEFSMSVSLADYYSMWGSDNLGVWFYDNVPRSTSHIPLLTHTPQINFQSYGPIIDTQNWVRLTGYFVADSTYDTLVIGGYYPVSAVNATQVSTTGTAAYYYIDSVVLRLMNGINNLYTDSMICAGDTFLVPYSLNNTNTFATTNIFSVQLSNSSGTFTTGTTIIGTRTASTGGSISCVVPTTIPPGTSYRLRILSSNAVDSSAPNQRGISIGVTRPIVSNSSNTPVCTGQPIHLYASSTTPGVTYRWTGPSNFTSTLQNPIIPSAAVSNSGDYIVTARLLGCVAHDTTNVVVSSTVAASVIANSTTPICERDSLILTATVPTSSYGYSWAGPGNFSSFAKDTLRVNAMPAMSGDYIFTAYYTGCTVKDTISVLVKPLAANRTIGSNSPVCTGNIFALSAGSSSTGVSYLWNGPNSLNTTFPLVNISNVTLSANGKYVITYDLNGCITKDSINVVVNPSPAAITATATTPICERDTLRLYSTNSSIGVSWSWNGPNSYTSTMQNPVHMATVPSLSGDYIVTATNSYNCTAKDTIAVLIKPLPANFNASSSNICEGNVLLLAGNTTSTGVSFSWVGPNSFNSTMQNPNIPSATPVASGAYILTATLNGCTDKDTTYVNVYPTPAKPVPSANTPVCTGQELKLSATNVAGATYSWTSTTGYTSALQNPIRTGATTNMAGKYYIQAFANGCPSLADSINVIVNPAPDITMYPTPNDSICEGATLTLISNQANASSTFQRTWYRNNNPIIGATGANFSTTSAADSDLYYVTLTGGNCIEPFTDTSNAITIRVFPWLAASVSITATPTGTVAKGTMINFTAKPVNGGNTPTYQWTRNGANIVGALSNVWGAPNLSNNDEICVNMTSSYLCPNPKTAKSNCIRVSIETTGIKGTWAGKQPAIYPNPVKDLLIIEGIQTGTIIQLTDVAGRTLIRKTAISNNETINTQSLIPGNYILLLDDNKDSNIRVKLTKE